MRWIRVLAVATLVATYSLIVLGSTVRVTNAGMGCPGWPLCYGNVGPIDRLDPLLEQSHRYLASVVTVMILALALLAWRGGPQARWVRGPASVAVGAIVVQIALGAITVITNNAPVTVALHLVVGLLFLAIVTVTAVAAFVGPGQSWLLPRQPRRLAWAAGAGTFFVLVTGSLVVDGGAQSACTSSLVCVGNRASGGLIALQLIHRSMVVVAAALIVAYLVTLLRHPATHHAQRVLAAAGVALLGLQVVLGAVDAWFGSPAGLADVHLAVAAGLWVIVVAVADLPSPPPRASGVHAPPPRAAPAPR